MQDKTRPTRTSGTRASAPNSHKLVLATAFAASVGACVAEVPADGDQPQSESAANELVRGEARKPTSDTEFYAPPPNPGALEQIRELRRSHQYRDAARIARLVGVPHAAWFTGGTPRQVQREVRHTMRRAGKKLPVLVAYNLPFRDCSQYSAGGALDSAGYQAWIDGFARGIGKKKAVVILEPDGLGLIPYNTTIYGAEDWCQPTLTDVDGNSVPAPGASPEDRYAQLNYAVDSILEKAPNAAIYLDGTHSAWLSVGEAAYRLHQAGISRAQGFFLNVSNYRATEELAQFGLWVSACLEAATAGADWALGHFDWCPTQYNPDLGYARDYSPEYAASVTEGLENMLGGATPSTTFVIDSSRNGQGPWEPDPDLGYPDPQDWCNPPGRGVGLRPRADTPAPLDALLWVKVPGESDGSCNRGIQGSTTDPEWGGIVDPAAGIWFPEQALELATLASPSLL